MQMKNIEMKKKNYRIENNLMHGSSKEKGGRIGRTVLQSDLHKGQQYSFRSISKAAERYKRLVRERSF